MRLTSEDGDTRIVRNIMDGLGRDKSLCGVPVIGFAVDPRASEDLDHLVKQNLIDKASGAFPGQCCERPSRTFSTPVGEDGEAEVAIYLRRPPSENWLDIAEDIIRAGLDSASGATCASFLHVLSEGSIESFKALLRPHLDPQLHQDLSGNRNTLYSRVFADLATALDHLNLDNELSQVRCRSVISEILKTIEPYQRTPLDKDITTNQDCTELLERDLRTGQLEYNEVLKKGVIIPLKLRSEGYAKNTVKECLESSTEATVKSLLEAMRKGDIALDSNPGEEAWKATFEFCNARDLEDVTVEVERCLYEFITPRSTQIMLSLWVDFWGVLIEMVTGIYDAGPKMRQKTYHRYIRRLLSGTR